MSLNEQVPRRERRDALENRARILAAAQELFDDQGVENVSMNGIAQKAGVGAGTLYRHFDSKSDLCFALLQDQLTLQADTLATLAASGDNPRSTFEEMMLIYLQFKEHKIPLFKSMEEGAGHLGGPMQSPVYESLRQAFTHLFERAAAHENIEFASTEAILRADLLLAALAGDSLRFQRTTRGLSLEELAAKTSALFYPHP